MGDLMRGATIWQRLAFCLINFVSGYLVWAALLGLAFIESNESRAKIALIYGLPIAVEFLASEGGAGDDFCQSLKETRSCPVLSTHQLRRHADSDRYELFIPARNGVFWQKAKHFFIGNKVCWPGLKSFGVRCLTAFEAVGPRGEDFFLCDRKHERCFFPELVGVQYSYG